MSVSIPDVRVGQPIACGGVAVFRLYSERSPLPDGDSTSGYALAHEAMAAGTVAVLEVCEAGSVGELLADNHAIRPSRLGCIGYATQDTSSRGVWLCDRTSDRKVKVDRRETLAVYQHIAVDGQLAERYQAAMRDVDL